MAKVNVKVKKRESLSDIFKGIASGVTGFFVFLILVFFPLYTHDKYFDILKARYVFYKVWTLSLVLILIGLGIAYLFIDYNNNVSSPSAIERLVSFFKIENLKKNVNVTDIFFIIMIISMTISTAGSAFKEESFYGSSGRFQGLECWILYFLTYIAISRTFKFKIMYLDFAIIAGCFSCIWGTMDFFQLDPFGFFVNVSGHQRGMFASSIGNLNTYTNYTIIIFALAATLFIIEKDFRKSIFYFVTAIIGCTGSIFGLADNIVFGFIGFYMIVPFFCIKTRRHLLRYLITIDILLFSTFLFSKGLLLPHNTMQSSFFQDLVNKSSAIQYLFIPFTVIVVAVYFALIKIKPNYEDIIDNNLTPLDSNLTKRIKYAYCILVAAGVLFVTYVLIDVNVLKINADFWLNNIPSSHQLVFDDNWGTHRGHNWRIAFTNFTQNFNFFQKLFGYGPDTYLIVSERTFYDEMVSRYGEVYDSAHNEYINYLICEGLIGLISYLGILISSVRYALKNMKNNPYIVACAMAVVAYAVQATVNIAIPISTPVYFTLMFICVSEEVKAKSLA